MSGVDVNRLRNWARGYQRLQRGGLGSHAHTACVDDFADDEGNYPYITAEDVLALLDERDALAAKVTRVVKVHAEYFDLDRDPFDDASPEPEDVWRFDRDLRAALEDRP